MNAKEEILKILTHQKLSWIHEKNIPAILAEEVLECEKQISYYNELITATESAIFDIPSEDEISAENNNISSDFRDGFLEGCKYILKYKKPKTKL